MVNRILTVGDDFTLDPKIKAGDANLPERLSSTALSATIADEVEAPIAFALAPVEANISGLIRTQISRGGVAAIGDSITAWGSASQTQHGDVWWNLLGIKTNQRIRFDAFYATAGHTMEQIESEHLPSVLAMNPRPGACFIFAGTNNVGAAFNIVTLAATHKRITDALTAAGIVPVLCTVPPRNNPTTAVQQVAQWNAYIRGKASQNGFPMLDVNAALIDPATGGFLAGLGEADAIHPNYAGHNAIATLGAASTALVNRFPDGAPYLARSINDAANMLGDFGMFVSDTNADGISDGWTGVTLPANATPSIVIDGEGRWQRLTKAAGQAGTAYVFRDIVAGSSWAVGDRFQFAGKVRFNTPASGNQGVLQAFMMGANVTYDSRTINGVNGIEYIAGTIPPGTTSIRINLMLTGTPSGAPATADFQRVTMVNLTKLGL